MSTYESASTRRFLLGRVDCIRSATTEALEWAKAMCQGEGPNVPLESDKEDDDKDGKKVTFSLYSVRFFDLSFSSKIVLYDYDNCRRIIWENSSDAQLLVRQRLWCKISLDMALISISWVSGKPVRTVEVLCTNSLRMRATRSPIASSYPLVRYFLQTSAQDLHSKHCCDMALW